MKKIIAFFCILLVGIACTNDDFADAIDQDFLANAEDQRSVNAGLIINKEVFDNLELNRRNGLSKGGKFEFKSVKRSNNVLEVELTFSGGCEIHTIDVVWDGVIFTDSPCSINLMIIHNDNNDKCEAHITKTFFINIKELIGDIEYKDICEYHLYSTFNIGDEPDIKTTN